MKDEYVLLEVKNVDLENEILGLDVPFAKIKDTMNYYLVQAPNEKLKSLYDKGAELILKMSEIPVNIVEFKNKFSESLDTILTKEKLPSIENFGYAPIHSSCPPVSQSDLKKRDSLLEEFYKGLLVVKRKAVLGGE